MLSTGVRHVPTGDTPIGDTRRAAKVHGNAIRQDSLIIPEHSIDGTAHSVRSKKHTCYRIASGFEQVAYKRESSGPTVTICYELLKHISQSLPKQTTPSGITPTDAAMGQALWLVLHEVGHAAFDIFDVPLFGHQEDAADNFATYIMLQFGKGQARPLIGGAAWAWRAYVADYRTNPVIREELAGFASNHGQPQERFYDLMCLAYGADPVTFAELTQDGFLPPSRSPNCKYEYKTLADAFRKEIRPHIDREMALRVMDTSWLPATQSMPTAQK